MAARYPFVSIIIVNYKLKELTRLCLDLVFAIDYPLNSYEVIVVDNDSQDDSVLFLSNLFKKRIKIIANNKNNYCQACNLGIKSSKGSYVVLLNNDVKVSKGWLLELVKVAESDPSVAAVVPKLLHEDGTIQNAGLIEMPNFYWDEKGAGKDPKTLDKIEEVDAVSGASVLYRKSALDQVGLLDEDFVMYGEDADMSLRLKSKQWKLVFAPASLGVHMVHKSSNKDFARVAIERNRLFLIAKHSPQILASALLGNAFFIAKDENKPVGEIYNLVPRLFLKLLKEHGEAMALSVMEDIFRELRRITSYENSVLHAALVGTIREVSGEKNRANHYKEESAKLEQELQNLSNHYKEEGAKLEKELQNISAKLKESIDKGLAQKNSIFKLACDIEGYRSENLNLNDRFTESLDSIKQQKQTISSLGVEIETLRRRINEAQEQVKQAEGQIASIYKSEGYRFILKPIWTLIFSSRKALTFFSKYMYRWLQAIVIFSLIPLVFVQAILFTLEWFFEFLFGKVSFIFRRKRIIVPFDKLSISIVIPNWNGIELLKKCLTSIYEIDKFKDGEYEVLVVDDASDSDIAECIKNEFPFIRVIRNIRNLGFGKTCNRGVLEARGELIVLLNNDIMVSLDFLQPLIAHFKDEQVFSVSPKLYYWDKKSFNYGMHMGEFRDGYINLWNESETGNGDKVMQTAPTIFSVGGAMCFRRNDFLWLGGFDGIYRPNCWEDIDISYRAQKRGLKVLYEPQSLVYHKGAATLNYLRHKEIKNELLFIWKNITDLGFLSSHLNRLPEFMQLGKHSSPMQFSRGYIWAFRYFIEALIGRFNEFKYCVRKDRTILNYCLLYYRNFMRSGFLHRDKKTILLITPFLPYPLTSGGKLRIFNLYKRLCQTYNIILLSLIHDENDREHINALRELFKDVHVISTKTPNPDPLFPRRYKYSFSNFIIEKLKELQEVESIDIIHIESNELLYLTRHIKYIPVVYTEHDISMVSFLNSYYKQDAYSLFSYIMDTLRVIRHHHALYNNISKVIALSKNDLQVIKAFSPKAVCSLIPTGVDLSHFAFKEKNGSGKVLIFVGHFPHYPNEEAVVYFCKHIFPLVKKSIPDVVFKIIGSAPTQKVKELNQIGGVELIGEVSDVSLYLQEASVFVCSFMRSAGIKGKILEAMATGTPVVCTARGACGIEAIHGKEILKADNPKDFSRHVINLLNDESLYKTISYNARKLVENKYGWDQISTRLDKLYQGIEPGVLIQNSSWSGVFHDVEHINTDFTQDSLVKDICNKIDRIVSSSFNSLERNKSLRKDVLLEELHLELTHNCNSKCITCDIWDYYKRSDKRQDEELSLEEIKKTINASDKLDTVKTVVLSGGEPFLRSDIVEICKLIWDRLPGVSIGILTNGMNSEDILNKLKEIARYARNGSLWLGTSLDGLNDAYDKMRGVHGGFERFETTLSRIKSELPQIKMCATFVLTPLNINELIPCWEYSKEQGLDFFAQFAVPKEAREKETFKWNNEDLFKVRANIMQIVKDIIQKHSNLDEFNISLSRVSDKIKLITQIYYWFHLVDFQQSGIKFSSQCEAGYKFAMLNPYGDLFFCPLLKNKTAGNIKTETLDHLLSSQAAKESRELIREGSCSCWLVCTVFPLVGAALARYGDQAASKIALRLKHQIYASSYLPLKKTSNEELNNEEYRQGRSILKSTPTGLTLGTNYNCNGNCIFCIGGEYKLFSLKLYREYFEPRLKDVLKNAQFISFCGMGELLLLPEIHDFIGYANKTLRTKNKIITTNGLAFQDRIQDRILGNKYSIQISLHASNSALHERLTGMPGSFDKIIGQIDRCIKLRRSNDTPSITLVFVATTLNIEDLPNVVKLASQLGVNSVRCTYLTVFKPAHLKLSCFFKQEITNDIFEVAKNESQRMNVALDLPPAFSLNGKPASRRVCSEPWKNIYVDTEGAVLPCCYSGEHFGNLDQNDFMSIWNNNKFQQLREDISSGNPRGMCEYCLNSSCLNSTILNSHVSFRPDVQEAILIK